jgi:hypothetical protein
MNCQEFWETLPDDTRHPHLAECQDCASRMERQQQLRAGLRALAAQRHEVQAPARVEARLMAAFEARSGSARERVSRGWMPAAGRAAAFAAMLLAGVMIVRDRQPAAGSRASQNLIAQNLEVAVLDGSAGTDSGGADGFVPLPGAAQLPTSDDLDIVRMELPRSAMMQVGIEVSPERAAESVQADVMVGPDGLARSVRFLEITGSD